MPNAPITDEQIRSELEAAWKRYSAACRALGYEPHGNGTIVPVGAEAQNRHRLEAAIARGIEAAEAVESRRTMPKSLLISYIADAIEY